MPDDALLALIAEVLTLDRVDEDAALGVTENWDSMRNMMIMVEIERVFAVKLPFTAYTEATSVRAIRALLASVHGA
jgi:acyl carrier protein